MWSVQGLWSFCEGAVVSHLPVPSLLSILFFWLSLPGRGGVEGRRGRVTLIGPIAPVSETQDLPSESPSEHTGQTSPLG